MMLLFGPPSKSIVLAGPKCLDDAMLQFFHKLWNKLPQTGPFLAMEQVHKSWHPAGNWPHRCTVVEAKGELAWEGR